MKYKCHLYDELRQDYHRKRRKTNLQDLLNDGRILFCIVRAGHVARMGEKRNAYRILVGKPEGKRPLGRPRRRCVDNIKMDLREIRWNGMDWIDLAHDRDQRRALLNTVMNLRVP
jgi:hypothetical protein